MRIESTRARPLTAIAMFCAVFSSSERRISIWPASGGSFSARSWTDADLVGEVGQEAAEVEADVAFAGRDRVALVFQHRDQLLVGGAVGVFPERLRGRGFQHFFGAVAGDLAQAAGGGAGEVLGVAGEDVLQFGLDVDVFVELVDQVVADGGADRRVLDQVAAGRDPVVGVERLALGPDREDAEEGEDGAEDDEPFDGASACAAHRARMVYVKP